MDSNAAWLIICALTSRGRFHWGNTWACSFHPEPRPEGSTELETWLDDKKHTTRTSGTPMYSFKPGWAGVFSCQWSAPIDLSLCYPPSLALCPLLSAEHVHHFSQSHLCSIGMTIFYEYLPSLNHKKPLHFLPYSPHLPASPLPFTSQVSRNEHKNVHIRRERKIER